MNSRHRFWLVNLAIILAVVLGMVTPAGQASPAVGVIIYVDADAAGVNNGSSWVDAFTGLQPALEQVVSGDQIWVAEGSYTPTYRFDPVDPLSACFQMKNGVAIYGGFAGTETALEQRDWVSHPTILSGDLGIVGDASDNSYHVFYHPEELALDGSAILDGFTISRGYASGYYDPHNRGGGMYNNSSSPTLTNINFSYSLARYGAGMYNYYSSPTLTEVTFDHNTAFLAGHGGGMWNDVNSNPVLMEVTFYRNSSSSTCGGMANSQNSNPTLMEVTFSSNSASLGGGMCNEDNSPTLTDVTFSDNSASDGGGMRNLRSSPSLTNVTFSGNSANYGGGMINVGSNPTLTNVTFSGNSAFYYGGGMSNEGSNPTLTNVTFSANSAGNVGGGMYNSVSSSPTLTNAILWGDSPGEIFNHDIDSIPVVTYSDIQGGYFGTGNIDLDPRFVRPPSPGSDGVWGSADDDYGDLRLHLSPAIDAGNNAAVPLDTLTDLLGQPRFVDVLAILDSGLGSPPVVDMGAYEAQYGYVFLPIVVR